MVPFLAVFAFWHPADGSSQRRASPGGCESPLAPVGLFVLCRAPSREEKQRFPPYFKFLSSA